MIPLPDECPPGWERITLYGGPWDGGVRQVPEGTLEFIGCAVGGRVTYPRYQFDPRDGRFVYVGDQEYNA